MSCYYILFAGPEKKSKLIEGKERYNLFIFNRYLTDAIDFHFG